MEKLCIDVRGFSVEKKKRVQDAFFELGYEWSSTHTYQHLGADCYGNVCRNGDAIGELRGYGDMAEQQRKYAITYPELMRKAGMDESDLDVIISTPTKEDLEAGINRLRLASQPTSLQEAIESYMHLLDSIKDPYARGVIKSQITDLTDLQYQQLTGENND